jgi:hypothetical protein
MEPGPLSARSVASSDHQSVSSLPRIPCVYDYYEIESNAQGEVRLALRLHNAVGTSHKAQSSLFFLFVAFMQRGQDR